MRSLAYRKSDGGDLPFVIHGFLDSFRTSPEAGLIAMSRWRAVMEPEIVDILARPGVEVWVAHHPGEKERGADLYGFVIVERDYLDNRRQRVEDVPLVIYCYVKQAYRGLGIARGLMASAGVGDRFNYVTETSDAKAMKRAGKLFAAQRQHLVVRFPKNLEEKANDEQPERPR